MARRTIVVSDLHLADVEDHDDNWKRYKHSRHLFDGELRELLRSADEDLPDGDTLTLVLAGDTFDFDVVTEIPNTPPWPISWTERQAGLAATPEKSAWKLSRILDDHPEFVQGLAEHVGQGHRLVFVVGNHDHELHFEAVQHALCEAIARAGTLAVERVSELLEIEPWFVYVPGALYIEHGHQYDQYNASYRVLHPFVDRAGHEIALPMGCWSGRAMLSHMGTMSPHATDFLMSAPGYLAHWAKHYALKPGRSLARSWFVGSILTSVRLRRDRRRVHRDVLDREALTADRVKTAERTDLDVDVVARIDGLRSRPIAESLIRVMREFWHERILLALSLAVAAAAVLAWAPWTLWLRLVVVAVAASAIWVGYERWAQTLGTAATVTESNRDPASELADLVDAPVIVMGHTHHAEMVAVDDDTVYVNTGTWAPLSGNGQGGVHVAPKTTLFVTVDDEEVAAVLRPCADAIPETPWTGTLPDDAEVFRAARVGE